MDAGRAALPGPSPASIAPAAGLQEGPDVSDQQRKNAFILRQLSQIMNSRRAADHPQQSEVSRPRRESEAEMKARIQPMVEQRPQGCAGGLAGQESAPSTRDGLMLQDDEDYGN